MCAVSVALGGVPPFAESAVCVVPQMIALGRGTASFRATKSPTPKRWREALRLPLSGWITPKSGAETPFAGAQSRLSPTTLPIPDASRLSKLGHLRLSTPRT